MWRKFMQTMVTIVAILICIIAIFLGVGIGANVDGFSGFLTFVVIVLVGFLMLGMTGMIAEGVEYLEIIAYETKNGNRTLYSQSMNPQSMNQVNTTTSISNAKGKSILDVASSDKADWYCSQCGEKNNTSNVFCKYCGTHK